MDFDHLLVAQVLPPEKRAGKAEGGIEHRLYEGAVMVAYAMHLLRTQLPVLCATASGCQWCEDAIFQVCGRPFLGHGNSQIKRPA
ncbi:MAG: hypothetical protein E5Y06_12405 [Mesorhizobium sp.]|uniref:hypothetical protein n=1 Tax=Mesorhizobium sp. TaxID=1871066 RepID=UPI00122AEF1D|nr:hypothetical protein [Mesorhizobium sp.]TIN95545.1 MAG: hypothetical protein E5Y06_12405 [Mesorhizobium sp.]TJU97192.1 MAG: hypothetical protein E5Y08_18995 [Mesorhizobium sp.]